MIDEPSPNAPGQNKLVELLKMALASVAAITAALSLVGIHATEADVSVWIQLLIGIAGIGSFLPSVKAVFKYKADAD